VKWCAKPLKAARRHFAIALAPTILYISNGNYKPLPTLCFFFFLWPLNCLFSRNKIL
jgi:hypothetical protein